MSDPKVFDELPPGAVLDELPEGAVIDEPKLAAAATAKPKGLGPSVARGGIALGLGALGGATAGFADELSGTVRAALAAGAKIGVDMASTGAGKALLRRVAGLPDSIPDEALDAAIARAGQQAGQTLGAELRPGLGETIGSSYQRGRDEYRAIDQASSKDSPWLHGIGTVAGTVAMPAARAGQVLGGGRALTTAGARALTGLGQGAAMGLGNSESDTVAGDLGNAALGAGIGGVASVGLGALGDAAGRGLRGLAENNALRALGLRAGIGNQLKKLGFDNPFDARQELAKRAMDEGLITFGSTPEGVYRDASEMLPMVGHVKGQAVQDIQDAAKTLGIQADYAGAADAAKKAAFGGASTIGIAKGGAARRSIDLIRQQAKTAGLDDSFILLDKLKQDAQNDIRPLTTDLSREQLNKVADVLREQMEQQSNAFAPDLADALKAHNSKYGFLKDVIALSSDEATRAIGRKGALGMAVGAAAGAGGGPMGGAGGAFMGQMAQRYLMPRLPSAFAVTENAASKAAPQAGAPAAALATKTAVDWFASKFGRKPESKAELAGSAFVAGQGGQ
jgi:hypothetical protein